MTGMLTYLFRLAAAAFGGNRPMLYVSTFFLGVTIHFAAKIVFSEYPELKWLGVIANSAFWYCSLSLLGIVFFGIAIRSAMVPEETADVLSVIDAIIDRARVSPAQRSLIWFSILEKFRDSITPTFGQRTKLPEMAKEAVREAEESEPKPE